MINKYMQLIQRQIEKLDQEDFDLEAWKSGTNTILHRVLGEATPHIKQIDSLKIDYSSWALRDSNSKYNPIETCKKKGKAILEAALDEIEILGVNQKERETTYAKLTSELKEEEIQSLQTEDRGKVLGGMKKEKLVKIVDRLLE